MNSLQTEHVSHATVMSAAQRCAPVFTAGADIVDDHTVGSVSATMTARLYATIHEPPISGS
jgi:hypothetical protein